MIDTITKELLEILRALKDFNKNFVIVGGVATMLYDYHEKVSVTDVKTLYTKDIDVGVDYSGGVPSTDVEKVFKEIGYSPEYLPIGDDPVPLIKYSKNIDDGDVEVEFLVPLFGAPMTKAGKPKNIKKLNPGMNAQQLRYFDILLQSTYEIRLSLIDPQADNELFVQVPSPGYYLLHKFLTLYQRTDGEKKEKDAFYIYDLLNRFHSNWDFLLEDTNEAIESFIEIYKKRVKPVKEHFRDFFGEPTSEGVILIMNEYERTYSTQFELSNEQVASFVSGFFKKL